MEIAHVEGATETWIQDILVALLEGLQRPAPTVLETGGFMGHTSLRLLRALEMIGAGKLIVAEWDPEAPERAQIVDDKLVGAYHDWYTKVSWEVRREDALSVIRSLPDESLDLVYLDDDHQKSHVAEELEALFPKMRPNGLITGHDVFGSCDLQDVFKKYGGYALDLPRLGPAGGLGLLQVR